MESTNEFLSAGTGDAMAPDCPQTPFGGLSVLDAIVQANLNMETLSKPDLEAFIRSHQEQRRRQPWQSADCFRTACT